MLTDGKSKGLIKKRKPSSITKNKKPSQLILISLFEQEQTLSPIVKILKEPEKFVTTTNQVKDQTILQLLR